MTYLLETERLWLREFTSDDAVFFLQLVNSPGWLEYIGDRDIHTVAQARAFLENKICPSYAEHGFGFWAVVLRAAPQPVIGMCGLVARSVLSHPDLGFAILPTYEGQGFITEASRAVLTAAQTQYALPTIQAIALPNNQASIRVLTKLGFQPSGELMYEGALLTVFDRTTAP